MSNRLMHHHDDAVFNIASVGNLFLCTVNGRAELRHVEAIRRTLALLRANHPKIASIAVVRSASAELTPEVRSALNALMRDMEAVSSSSAIILEGDGILKGVIRAAAVGLMILARAKFPHKTFADIPAGLDWVLDFVEPPPTETERSAMRRDIIDYYAGRTATARPAGAETGYAADRAAR